MLTAQQSKLLAFLDDRLRTTGVCPSFEEMMGALQLRSKSGVHRLICGLEERGYIRRLTNRARAIDVVHTPSPSPSAPSRLSAADRPPLHLAHGAIMSIPKVGRIAAGSPIEAIQQQDGEIALFQDMLGRDGEFFALSVSGDSMIDAGIHDGDTVVIRRANSAQRGDIVVALLEQSEATLKEYDYRDGFIILRAANRDYPDRHLRPEQVAIQGTLACLVRPYKS